MTIIGLKELRQNTSEIAERANKGELFTVVKRSKPMFNLTPINNSQPADNELASWTKEAIIEYRPALEALNDK